MTDRPENNQPDNNSLEKAYLSAVQLAEDHYENFPVISYFLPKNLKKHVAVIYQFARTADDIADEGNLNPEERLKKLDEFEIHFNNMQSEVFKDDYWKALNNTIEEFKLTRQNFLNLLKAFKQDVVKTRYSNFKELLDYCSNSANPVGRIMLELFNIRDEQSIKYSDDICSALQLTNFYQDVSVDILKGRIYLPLDELSEYVITEKEIIEKQFSQKFRELMKFQVKRTDKMFANGRHLLKNLNGKFKFQIKMTINGGRMILQKIKQNDFDTLATRPSLSKKDYFYLFIKTLIFG